MTVFLRAAKYGNRKVMRFCLEKCGSDVNDYVVLNGRFNIRSALMLAVSLRRVKAVRFLLARGADPSFFSGHRTPLTYATWPNWPKKNTNMRLRGRDKKDANKIIRLLFQYGAKVICPEAAEFVREALDEVFPGEFVDFYDRLM